MKNRWSMWEEEKLPYPLKKSGIDGIEIYEIPEEMKEKVLDELYPFLPCPSLSHRRRDLHLGKTFEVSQFMVVRERRMNLLVSPFYLESGGTVIDWVKI